MNAVTVSPTWYPPTVIYALQSSLLVATLTRQMKALPNPQGIGVLVAVRVEVTVGVRLGVGVLDGV